MLATHRAQQHMHKLYNGQRSPFAGSTAGGGGVCSSVLATTLSPHGPRVTLSLPSATTLYLYCVPGDSPLI
jgi:hypothetical protein